MIYLDYETKEIKLGSKVVFTEGAKGISPASILIGEVIGFTPASIRIKYSYKSDPVYTTEMLKYPGYVCVI